MNPHGEEPAGMSHETRLERRLDTAVARATTPRGAAIVIGVASVMVTVGAGIVMTVLDRENYPSIGSGLWWAIQTTTTVGYGDNVPTTFAGRLVAAMVMLFGIGFLTVITAAITSTFVARSRMDETRSDTGTPTAEELRRLDDRLDRIEATLTEPSSSSRTLSDSETPTAGQLRELDGRLDRIEAVLIGLSRAD